MILNTLIRSPTLIIKWEKEENVNILLLTGLIFYCIISDLKEIMFSSLDNKLFKKETQHH